MSNTPGSTTSRPSPASVIPRIGKTRSAGTAAGPGRAPAACNPSRAASGASWPISLPTQTARDRRFLRPFDFEHPSHRYNPLERVARIPHPRPRSKITGERMEKIEWGPNWEEILGGEFAKRSQDYNFEGVQKDIYGEYENTFMMYLPRLCEHCLNPACVASCPSGAIYKREDDGVVLIDQEKCRGWRMCVSGCPYKKIYYNWSSGKSEKCILCYPRLESGQPTVCSETCVGRIRYLGVMLYDADKIAEAAATESEMDLYDAQLGVFLDPNDPEVIAAARAEGIPEDWIKGAQNSPIWKMAMEWKIAFPLHPEYRTLPMVWYVPPLSPIQNAAEAARSPRRMTCPTCGRCASRCVTWRTC
nr:nitrate reductase subunit beta [Paracoccus mutanolyticus]